MPLDEADPAPSPVDLIVHSPRGLIALTELCGVPAQAWHPATDASPRHSRPSARPLVERLLIDLEDGSAIDRLAPELLGDIERLAATVVAHIDGLAWWDASRYEALHELLDHGAAFRGLAAHVLGVPATRWWDDDIDGAAQVTLGPVDAPPDLAALAADQFALIDRSPWRLPQALTTSVSLGPRLPSVRLGALEAVSRWPDPVGCWSVSIHPQARIYEVHNPRHWTDLCERYPWSGPRPPDFARWGVPTLEASWPDWFTVATDWDGVHVSMTGLLGAAGVPVIVGGRGTVLEDVDSEFTTWFRPMFTDVRFRTDRPWETVGRLAQAGPTRGS